ncbi:MAG: type II toxin-antitoxin system RelB/DinJ family antitoxin [Firmicutes bacterium]|nr:type II toxin-antitoxin system RelB/DinJ family antitoxin [Bacillota bacterium]
MNVTYNIRIDKNVKEQADKLYKNMGLSISSAINLFLKQSIIQGKLPIREVSAEPYYAEELRKALVAYEQAKKDGTLNIYKSTEELFAKWDKEDAEDEK